MSNNLGWTEITENDPIAHEIANDNFGLFDAAISASTGWDFGFSFSDQPDPDTVIRIIPIVRDITIPADMTGSLGIVEVNPDLDYPIDVTVDTVSIGTITIQTDGTFVFETDGGTAKDVSAGSFLRFVSPPASPAITSILGVDCVVLANVRSA